MAVKFVIILRANYPASGRDGGVLRWACLSVCLSVCEHTVYTIGLHVSGNDACPIFNKFVCLLPTAVARSPLHGGCDFIYIGFYLHRLLLLLLLFTFIVFVPVYALLTLYLEYRVNISLSDVFSVRDISILIDFLCAISLFFVLAHVYFIFHRVGLFVYFVYDFSNNNNNNWLMTSVEWQTAHRLQLVV